MIIVFDLDDTLYPEESFVLSGFRAVAAHLAGLGLGTETALLARMLEILAEDGRGAVFNRILAELGVTSQAAAKRCVTVYRLHRPKITMPEESITCLERFREHPLYLVTDGNKVVQWNKVAALGIAPRFRKVFITHRYGVQNAKPSPLCFHRICQLERAEPARIVYIGDNPRKDFVGIKPLGFKTIRVLTGPHAVLEPDAAHAAHLEIASLRELDFSLVSKLMEA